MHSDAMLKLQELVGSFYRFLIEERRRREEDGDYQWFASHSIAKTFQAFRRITAERDDLLQAASDSKLPDKAGSERLDELAKRRSDRCREWREMMEEFSGRIGKRSEFGISLPYS